MLHTAPPDTAPGKQEVVQEGSKVIQHGTAMFQQHIHPDILVSVKQNILRLEITVAPCTTEQRCIQVEPGFDKRPVLNAGRRITCKDSTVGAFQVSDSVVHTKRLLVVPTRARIMQLAQP